MDNPPLYGKNSNTTYKNWKLDIPLIKDGQVKTKNGFELALITRIIDGNIQRDAVGGAIIYDDKHNVSGHVEVAYHEDKPYALYYKDKLLAYMTK